MDPQKKISFSFSRSSKPTNILNSKQGEEKKDVELIDCLEEQSIKVKSVVVEEVRAPLVIPLRDDSKDLLDRIRQFRQNKNDNNRNYSDKDKPDSELTLDELAAQQLIKEAKQETKDDLVKEIHTVPLINDNELNQNNKESTLEDYDNVPVGDFGVAMLRGMGWTESTGIGKNNKRVSKPIEPELRPRGMGLGANKIINHKQEVVKLSRGREDELSLVKGSFAKIIAGNNKGNYCEVVGLDDESGRVIVKTVIAQVVLPLNEFLLVPVSKEEFYKNGKVLNNAKYEEYKTKDGSKSISANSDDQPSTSREANPDGRLSNIRDHDEGRKSDKRGRDSKHHTPERYNNDYYRKKKKAKKYKDYDEREKKYEHKKSKKHKRSRSRSRDRSQKKRRYDSNRSRSGSSRSSNEDVYRYQAEKKRRR
ncbi:hypothetical protein Trydic_g18634 [Trypoxylus dichotomus]